ncbi:hypothetical protein CTI12_AA490020 [Artemisia annua]|uniref:Helitron helicase-like domain-containing protein n=1 Tax=Artemisia annua TaxID=35608 RepID=A0A2U1LHZ9_ARTAN|nr:hypothetical protein CTI12_AA490020 [Artemisia annua]
MDENNERLSRKRKTDVPNKKKPQASNQRLPLSEIVTAPSNTRVSLAELLTYDPLTGTLPTSHLSNTSSTQQEKLKGSFAQTKRRPRNVLPLADVTNYFPQSLNAVSNLVNSSTDSSSAFCQVSFQTPESHKVNQRTNNTPTSFVQRTIPSIITQNSSYEVGESSRRTKRSKIPSLQAPTPVSNSSSSSGPSNSKHPIDRNIINEVRAVLDTSSELVQTFRRARDRYTEDTEQNIKIKLIAKRGKDGRNYNLPTANEVAGLIVGDFDSCAEQRDIIIDKRGEGLQRINIFHPMYLPLQYPLLMPRAQDGYHLNIPLRKTGKQTATNQRTTDKKDKNDKTVTMRQWFSYHIMDRPNQENLFTHGGRLFQQFLVDGYTMVETERLYFHRSKQSKLRCDTYSNIRQSIASGNTDPTALGKPLLRSRGTTLRHWPEMPYPDDTYITDFGNRLIHEETDYNPVELQSEYERIKKRVHGESSSHGEEGQEKELDINVLLKWFDDERKKKAAKEAKKLLAKDEKEFSRSKALVVHEEDDFSDVSLDGLDYEEAHLAFDKEKSPKFHD